MLRGCAGEEQCQRAFDDFGFRHHVPGVLVLHRAGHDKLPVALDGLQRVRRPFRPHVLGHEQRLVLQLVFRHVKERLRRQRRVLVPVLLGHELGHGFKQ